MKKLFLLLAFLPTLAQAERGDFNFRELNRTWINLDGHGEDPIVTKIPANLSAFEPTDRQLYQFVKDTYAEKELNVGIQSTGDKGKKAFLKDIGEQMGDDAAEALKPLLESKNIRNVYYLYGTGDAWVYWALVIVDQNYRVGLVSTMIED